ncbi:MAG: hypothetical protein A2487_00760 [Candidatus Raymondbacteria bacterium RifOxyC12_full_50_8]|uniref:Uncharacterized protein n=1 Tax=Candidatus Raymondbacteria bacterium RIFOXYD12_FULL_49_13 TaxID=1817890 RepID=A0A1F7F9J7_UNCRA|nr:MAG: hypothetical protein A2350_03325 [Candidatus Raymondbacteria bacterium RifOxyB12_full_50_8]OGJ93258.1 MAG: hypothetical protein A2248_17980 [Candidatus Raymondbacteria bacterium RIFOXYA2_FULL_49_16]OGJ98163.1 MAG: hypothetical protein A2487_00760 [Candidatus Raymondbacteria bacterium RifOxyC12_full_50_8]OGK03340.1 MAG: hypothetical protein A2519_15325 [Candidatus Raymondbacteria bacterium RIFOXYD12_FULL_49_13]OGP44980.1 MAG: hypothetical protein A2324_19905 [Candidatus Raymondbacteria b
MPGFALLENVVLIYNFYKKGKLRRKDFTFKHGLAFRDFVDTYFDIWEWSEKNGKNAILFFHPKIVSACNDLISIPGDNDYYAMRAQLFEFNPWMSKGCVFLSEKITNWPQGDTKPRHCILHSKHSSKQIGPKPIDCVFHTCILPKMQKLPEPEVVDKWFSALARAFPGSVRRYNKYIDM